MVKLDKIKQLEARVSKAIELMQTLKDENDLLKLELHDRQQRIEELENIVLVFRNDQAKIEEGIINALNHLSAFEDTVYQAANSTAASAVHEAAPAANEAPEMQPTALNPTGAVASEQPNPIHEEASETQSPTAVAETVPQQAPQEPINHSNQLDIF